MMVYTVVLCGLLLSDIVSSHGLWGRWGIASVAMAFALGADIVLVGRRLPRVLRLGTTDVPRRP
jgi:hypothetical protein